MADVPATFGKYFLTEKLAVGGMAEIYLAKLIGPGGFEKPLIIKQIHPRLSDQPQFVDLFVAEAKTLVALSHGNIVPIYELGMVDDRYFIAMEYIDGPTLERLQRALHEADEEMDPRVATYITAELLKGLDYAHRKGVGVVHRDLSPRNVMISRDGEVKLVDFGIAVALEQQRASTAGDDSDLPGTRPEGSYPYMSPEQVRNQKLTGQSDLFSAGVLLWEMLTGEMLFARESAEATLDAVLHAPIEPPSQLRAGLPPELDAICLRALAREPAQRWETAGQFLAAVNRWLYATDMPVTPAVLARLVAARCPAGKRRAPSVVGAGGPIGDEPSGPVTVVDRTGGSDPNDRTRPLPREVARRASTKSFATNVHFQRDVLSRATPLFPVKALDGAAGASTPSAPTTTHTSAAAEVPARRGRGATLITGIVLLAAVATTIAWMVLRSGGGPAAAGGGLAGAPVVDAAPAAARADAGVPVPVADAAVPDAGPPPPRRDAGPARRPDAGTAPLRGKGVIKVSAIPYGDVYIDGKKKGRAPDQWPVSAGKHKVTIVFMDRSKSFTVTVDPDEIEPLFFDFTAGP